MLKFLRFFGPLLAGVVFIFFLEMFLRAFFVDPKSLANYGYNPNGLGDLLPNKNFVDSNVNRLPYSVITNSQGLRNEEEIDFSDNNFRVLAIGDSFTYCPYVNNQDTWPAVLERKLREKYPERKVQVLNAGIAGYTITDELEYLKEKGIKTKPNLVILGIYANDLNDLSKEKREVYARSLQKQRSKSWANPLKDFAKKTAFFNFLEKLRIQQKRKSLSGSNTSEKQPMQMEDANLNEYKKNLGQFISFCQKEKLPLLIIIFPEYSQLKNSNQTFQENITNFVEGRAEVSTLGKEYYGEADEIYLVPLNTHLSVFGCLTTGQSLFDYILIKMPILLSGDEKKQ